jgi:hypothetical protein
MVYGKEDGTQMDQYEQQAMEKAITPILNYSMVL